MGAATGVRDTPVDLRGALPGPGDPPPLPRPPCAPLTHSRHAGPGRQHGARGGWPQTDSSRWLEAVLWANQLLSLLWEGEEGRPEVPGGSTPLPRSRARHWWKGCPPHQHRTIARPATVTLGALLSVSQPWKRGSRGGESTHKAWLPRLYKQLCVPGSAAAKGSQPCGVGGHQVGLPGGGWRHQRESRLYPLAQARLSSEASVSSFAKWGHFLLAGNEVRISLSGLNNHSNVSCFFSPLIEV